LLNGTVSLQEGCERLVALANERGGHDNITVLLAQVGLKRPKQVRAPLRQSETPTQPYIPRPVIRKRKSNPLGSLALLVLFGAIWGLVLGLALRIWHSAKSQQLPPPKVLKPQKATVGSISPAVQPILLRVKLTNEGIQFTAENGEMEVSGKAREVERKEEGIVVRFKYPKKSYGALKSGQANVALVRGNERHECLLTDSECSLEVTEGEWEVLYAGERRTAVLLCTLTVKKASQTKPDF
jgi:hypothetical protein